jgi:hypothetical protein
MTNEPETIVNRPFQVLLIASTVVFSWLAMQAVHEAGHVLHAWLSGGQVTRVVLHPLEISLTDVSPNPHPQFVAWGGPVWGSIFPLLFYGIVRRLNWPRAWLARFFAGFCLVANGGYLLGGSVYPAGDADVLLKEGAPRVALAAFGIVTMIGGLRIWNGLGAQFGLGKQAVFTDRRAAIGMVVAAVVLAAAECIIARR